MSVRLYDEAIWTKINKWVKDPNIRILKPDESTRLFQMQEDINNDKPLTLPLISISRDSSIEVDIPSKHQRSFDGKHIGLNTVDNKTAQLNSIPITVHYQVDIYTKEYEEGDEYLRNFIFNFVNYPALKITIPYNGANVEHVAYLRLMSTVTDNSDIKEKLFPDQFTRWTLQLELQDAYLYSIPTNKNYEIKEGELDIIEKDEEEKEVVDV